jgi:ABC-type lipoprotein release transport system permease subunit
MRARTELSARWRALVGLGLLAGLLGGVVIAAAAGARRTDSAYSRFLAVARAPELSVSSGLVSSKAFNLAKVAQLPQVAEAREFEFINYGARTRTGKEFTAFGDAGGLAGPLPYWGDGFNRPRIVAGRLADPTHADEFVVGEAFARREGLSPGTTVQMALFDTTTFQPSQPFTMRLVGVVVLPGMLPAAPEFVQVLFTPAFFRQHADTYAQVPILLVKLKHGQSDVAGFERAADLVGAGASSVGPAAGYDNKLVMERVTHLQGLTLWMFAGLAALAGLLILGQTLARFTTLESTENPILRTLGMTRGQLFAVAMTRAAVISAVGALVAAGLAIATSPIMPVGLAHLAEPKRGISSDALVVVGGAALLVGVVFALAAILAVIPWRVPQAGALGSGGTMDSARPGTIAGALVRRGGRASLVTGVRMAFEPGRGRTAVPVQTALAAIVVSTLALGTNMAFVASYGHWRATPRLYGWNWDALVGGAFGAPDATPRVVGTILGRTGRVEAWAAGTIVPAIRLSRGSHERTEVNVWGLDPVRGSVHPPVVHGRWPSTPDEVALGSETMRALGARLGERIELRTNSGMASMRVVGQAVFLELGDALSPGLGVGAGFTLAGARRLVPTAEERAFLVRFRPGTDVAATIARLNRTRPIDDIVNGPLTGTDIELYSGVERIPLALGSLLTLVAVATLAHVLMSAVRRRRRDLAILKTIGFVRAQVQWTVAWQATAFATAALVVGIPLGIGAGRWWWTLFAGRMGIVPDPVVPLALLGALLPAGVLLANLVAAIPARIAARTQPALVLRSE